jgi:hypothetical protein
MLVAFITLPSSISHMPMHMFIVSKISKHANIVNNFDMLFYLGVGRRLAFMDTNKSVNISYKIKLIFKLIPHTIFLTNKTSQG